jgi:hypothetical protein
MKGDSQQVAERDSQRMDEKEWPTYGLKVPGKILELVLLICLHL